VPADSLVPSLIRSLEANKQPKSRICIMQFAASYLAKHHQTGLSAAAANQLR
jgi:hypothetical protein